MNVREKQQQPKLSVKFFQKNTENIFTRFAYALSLSASVAFSLPAVQAADDSFAWAGPSGNWTDQTKWTPQSGVSGIPNNANGRTFDATMRSTGFPGSTATLDQNIEVQMFNFESGNITGPGNLGVNELFTWDRGTMSGSGTIRADGGTALLGGTKSIEGNRALLLGSGQTTNWTSGNLILKDANSRLVNEAGATFNLKANTRLTGNGLFDNAGNVQLQLNDPSQAMTFANPVFNNSGTVNVQTGELRIGGSGTSSGSFSVGPIGTLNFSGGIKELQGSSSVTGSMVKFTQRNGINGVTNVGGNYNVDVTEIDGNTVNFNANDSRTKTLNLRGGDLSGSGILNVDGQMEWTAGTQSGTGTTRLNGGSTITGSGLKQIKDDRIIVIGNGQTAN